MAEGIHRHQGSKSGNIAEVVPELALGERGAGSRLDRHDADLLALDLVVHERKADARQVASAAAAADHDVGIVARDLHLFLGLKPDHGLMQAYVVQHRAEGIVGVIVRGRVFHSLGNGEAEAARVVRVNFEGLSSRVRDCRRTCMHRGTPRLHLDSPVGFLAIAHLHHVHRHVKSEKLARKRHGCPPLSGTRLCSDSLDPCLLIIKSLGDGCVRLVAARRAHALVFIIDLCRSAERLLEPVRAKERRGPPEGINVEHLFGNVDPAFCCHFLFDKRHGEDRREVIRSYRLFCAGMKGRLWQVWHISHDVVPLFGYFPVRQHYFCLLHFFLRKSLFCEKTTLIKKFILP